MSRAFNYASVGHTMTSEEWYKSDTYREQCELLRALTSRPLTVEELQRVAALGYHLLVAPNVSYNAAEKIAEFNGLLLIQHSIQIAAKR